MWTPNEISFLSQNYPLKGKLWCMNAMKKSEGQIRSMAAKLNLKIDQNGEFFKKFQKQAALSKIGKKRPIQSLIMKEKAKQGNLALIDWVKNNGEIISENSKKRIAKNGHPKGMLGKKHNDQAKKKMSEAGKKLWANLTEDQKDAYSLRGSILGQKSTMNRLNASWKAAWRNIGGTEKYYRSRWEANYARYLQWLKENNQIKDWKHEPKTFWFEGIKRGCVSYLPDFWVQELNDSESYHEVKGWMDDRSKTKIKRMAIYHPKVKLVVIDAKNYKEIEKKTKLFVPHWE